jgi:FlaA1/EpsC-like NDP-sugar epimerase
VLVTGAGGSIGSELCRQVLRYGPRTLVLFERSEHALWQVDRELRAHHPDADIVTLIGDVTDRRRIDEVLTTHAPQVVLHAAAHKHVPMMEANPAEAVANNVVGTKVVADACAANAATEVFVLISTDKAVNPTSVMGATKRLAERYVTEVASRHPQTRFVSVRFGNVLGSTGSVIPIFREQIAAGGPVTVTDPEMTRYFMTIPEAAGLVLQAATLATDAGEVFLLDMGDPVRIVDLANEMIRLSGLEPGRDIEVVFTGARPGEKLFEELRYDDEGSEPTAHPKVWKNVGDQARWPEADDALEALVDIHDPAEVRAALLRMTRRAPS